MLLYSLPLLLTFPGAPAASPALPDVQPALQELEPARAERAEDLVRRYAAAMFDDRDPAVWGPLISEDFGFVDPTSDLWNAPYAEPIEGRELFLQFERTWSIEWSRFERQQVFRSGADVILTGTIAWKAAGQPEAGPIAFATVLTTTLGEEPDGDRVKARRDYGDYDDLAPGSAEANAALETHARAFLEAWANDARDDLEALSAHTVHFVDASRHEVAGGRGAVLQRLATRTDAPRDLELQRVFVSTRHVVLWGTRPLAGKTIPFALALEFDEEDLVSEVRVWNATPAKSAAEVSDG